MGNDQNINRIKVYPEVSVALSKGKADLGARTNGDVIAYLIQISETKIRIEKNGREEEIELLFLPIRLRNNWKIKAIDLEHLSKLDYKNPIVFNKLKGGEKYVNE